MNPSCVLKHPMGCNEMTSEAAEAVNVREASEFEQAMAELNKASDKELKDLLLQKYGVTPVQLTEEEQEQCR